MSTRCYWKMRDRLIFITTFCLSFFLYPQLAFAEETGFRFPTSCTTNGTSCDNMKLQDTNYNSWISTQYEEVIATFTDFGIPEDAVIDDIQVKLRIRTSPNGGWTWLAYASIDNGATYYSPANCSFSSIPRCRYNTTTAFNAISAPTFTWFNNNPGHTFTGKDLNSSSFRFLIWQSTGIKNTDIDTLLINVRYHFGQPSVTPLPTTLPTPTAIPTPTATPTPTPPPSFLDLPWDYEEKGMTFNEAALSITSFFDHEYPLLSSGLGESAEFFKTIVKFNSIETQEFYTSHDGYDYASLADVDFGDSVLAAASGSATYVNSCGACGNAIFIDHGNGYQTRYYHLQYDGLITTTPGDAVEVAAGEEIGKVGFSGNVIPKNEEGAHIHFMVIQDKDMDDSFGDNIPDGVTDPYGWQSEEDDPWGNYSFFYGGQERTGNKSYYLWKKKLDGLKETLTSNGGVFKAGKTTLEVEPGIFSSPVTLEMRASPLVKATDSLWSVGPAIEITAKNLLGDFVTLLTKPVKLWWAPFDNADLSRFKLGTLYIYSSPDGRHWTKEQIIDPVVPGAITAAVSHFTFFAVMGERKDIVPPITSAVLSGENGTNNWFRSDVSLSLIASDSADIDPAGVSYTAYQIEGEEWQEYTTPLNFTAEGHHKIHFYSQDNDGNIEDVKTVEFDIDKTLPVVSLDVDRHSIWPPNGKMVDVSISGESSDAYLLSTKIQVLDEYREIESLVSHFGQTIKLEAKRRGSDEDGRMYTIQAIAEDLAGNTNTAVTTVVVPHDKGE